MQGLVAVVVRDQYFQDSTRFDHLLSEMGLLRWTGCCAGRNYNEVHQPCNRHSNDADIHPADTLLFLSEITVNILHATSARGCTSSTTTAPFYGTCTCLSFVLTHITRHTKQVHEYDVDCNLNTLSSSSHYEQSLSSRPYSSGPYMKGRKVHGRNFSLNISQTLCNSNLLGHPASFWVDTRS